MEQPHIFANTMIANNNFYKREIKVYKNYFVEELVVYVFEYNGLNRYTLYKNTNEFNSNITLLEDDFITFLVMKHSDETTTC